MRRIYCELYNKKNWNCGTFFVEPIEEYMNENELEEYNERGEVVCSTCINKEMEGEK